jgi:hypothetical protein
MLAGVAGLDAPRKIGHMQAKWAGLALAAVLLATAATAASAPRQRPAQHGSSQGVRVAVYRSGLAVFDLRRIEPTPRRLLTGPSGLLFGCVKAHLRHGLWRTSEYTVTGRFARELRFRQGTHFAPPYAGCELGGLYGHQWDDAFGTRNAVEIWLTVSGRHFFNDRAAARDLAYFVRSGRVQRIRMSADPRVGLEALARRYPGRVIEIPSPSTRVHKDEVGFWIGPETLVFTVTSSTGRRFYVVATRGTLKLPVKNLGDLALVF